MTVGTPPRIVVLGEALVDVFPDKDVIGGAPFNVARNLAALGAHAVMVTRIGIDANGRRIADEFERLGMEGSGLQHDPRRATGAVQVRLQPGGGHRFEIGEDAAWDALDTRRVLRTVAAARPALVYFGTLAQRCAISRTAIRAAIRTGRAEPPPVRFLDLNLREGPDNRTLAAASLALADVVKINDEELDWLLSWFVGPSPHRLAWQAPARRAAIETLARNHGLRRLIITRGAEGWACFDAETGHWLEGTAPTVAVRDTVGAGDAFTAVMLLGMARHWPLETALQRAGEFAAQVCTFRGAMGDDPAFYTAWREAWV